MNILTLHEKRETLKGTKIIRLLKHLAVTHYSFRVNYNELSKLINIFEKDDEIIYLKNREKIDRLLYEFSRLLLNYISSVSTFVDHVRRVRHKLNNDKIDRQFKKELDNISKDENIIFLKDLRNYTIHEKLPEVAANFTLKNQVNGQNNNQELGIVKEAILESTYWTRGSKDFLSKQAKMIPIKKILNSHYQVFNDFQEKFYKLVTEEYKNEIQDLIEVERQMNKWMNKKQPKEDN